MFVIVPTSYVQQFDAVETSGGNELGKNGLVSLGDMAVDANAPIELAEPMLQTREGGVVLGADVGEVGSRSIAPK